MDLKDLTKVEDLELGFDSKSKSLVLRGAIDALDGFLIWQRIQGTSVDIANRYYFSRKKKLSMLLLSMCDLLIFNRMTIPNEEEIGQEDEDEDEIRAKKFKRGRK